MKRCRPVFFLLVIAVVLGSCSPHSSEEFQTEGEVLCRSLIETLQPIDSSEKLLSAEPVLKKKFESLVALMIEASTFVQKHPDSWDEGSSQKVSLISVTLKEQLHRIYSIEGGREVIERAQQESLVKLDAYERSRLKQREQPNSTVHFFSQPLPPQSRS